jgi:hypothetical protein
MSGPLAYKSPQRRQTRVYLASPTVTWLALMQPSRLLHFCPFAQRDQSGALQSQSVSLLFLTPSLQLGLGEGGGAGETDFFSGECFLRLASASSLQQTQQTPEHAA